MNKNNIINLEKLKITSRSHKNINGDTWCNPPGYIHFPHSVHAEINYIDVYHMIVWYWPDYLTMIFLIFSSATNEDLTIESDISDMQWEWPDNLIMPPVKFFQLRFFFPNFLNLHFLQFQCASLTGLWDHCDTREITEIKSSPLWKLINIYIFLHLVVSQIHYIIKY